MKIPLPLSTEMLNAYVDGEIDGEELGRIIALEATNKDLAEAICEVRKLKNLVKAARAPEPEKISSYLLSQAKKKNARFNKNNKPKTNCWAASLIMAVLVMASGSYYIYDSRDKSYSESVSTDKDSLLTVASSQQNSNLVVHFKTENLSRADKLFSTLEKTLIKSQANNINLHIEVIVSGPGLVLLQNPSSINVNRIRVLQEKYKNVTFLACGKTLQRLQKKLGKDVQLISDAQLIASGPEWIKQRKARGWAYFLI